MNKSYPQSLSKADIRMIEIVIQELQAKFKKPRRETIISRTYESVCKRIIPLDLADVREIYENIYGKKKVRAKKIKYDGVCLFHCGACSDINCTHRKYKEE